MYTDIFWIETPGKGKVGIMPRPRGGDWLEGEISYFKEEGVDAVVSLLTYPEICEFQLSEEESLCNNYEIDFFSVPVDDRCVPETIKEILDIVSDLNHLVQQGKSIAIHCRQGIGRSSLLAASVLTALGLSAKEAFKRIECSRGREAPDTVEQKEWV